MAYNRKNILSRMIDVQEIYLKYQALGLNSKQIFELHVKTQYRISRMTFYNYLGTNAKKELKDIENNENLQSKFLFPTD